MNPHNGKNNDFDCTLERCAVLLYPELNGEIEKRKAFEVEVRKLKKMLEPERGKNSSNPKNGIDDRKVSEDEFRTTVRLGQQLKMQIAALKKSKDEVLTINTLLVRALILYGIGFNIINLILILLLKKNAFICINTILGYIQYAIIIIIIFMVIFRKDGRGLHDIISGTVVVNEEEIK